MASNLHRAQDTLSSRTGGKDRRMHAKKLFFPIKLYVFLGNWRPVSSPNHALWAVFPPQSTATQIAIAWPNRTQLAMGLPLFSEKARRASLCFLRKYEVFPLRLFSENSFLRTLLQVLHSPPLYSLAEEHRAPTKWRRC